jgi:F420-0:gamma-glutamyl ligase-like protein
MFRLRKRATPIAIAGSSLSLEEVLRIAHFADKVRRSGAGRTVWQMAKRFEVGLTDVSWEMLKSIAHRPIVILRKISD